MAGRLILGTANPSVDGNGKPIAGSTLTFYQNLTTTPATVYSAYDLLTPLANPLTCDASGEFPQVWSPSYIAYSVKWSRPGLADITYDNIFASSDIGQALNYGPEANVSAAATTDLNTSAANRQVVLGNTAITSFGTGTLLYRILRFTGTPLLTYNASSLVTPTGANIQAAPGDVAIAASDESGNWRILSYQRGAGVVQSSVTAAGVTTSPTNMTTISIPPGKWRLSGMVQENGSGAGSNDIFTFGISANSASYTGCVQGKSRTIVANGLVASSSPRGSGSLPGFDVTLTATTSYYLVANTLTNSDNFDGSMRADPII